MSLQGLGLITGQEDDHDSCAMEANTWVNLMLLCEPKEYGAESRSRYSITLVTLTVEVTHTPLAKNKCNLYMSHFLPCSLHHKITILSYSNLNIKKKKQKKKKRKYTQHYQPNHQLKLHTRKILVFFVFTIKKNMSTQEKKKLYDCINN